MKIKRIKNLSIPTNFCKNALRKFLLIMLLVVNLDAFGATYYLTSAGASEAQRTTSWNTAANGSGSVLSSWNTASTNDTYIIPIGISGTWDTAVTRLIGNSGGGAQSFTFVINGSLTITNNSVITFDGGANVVTWTTNGTLTINEEGGDETFKTSNVDYAYFIFASGSTLISNNRNGISGTNNSIFGTELELEFLHDPGANYRFINTANTTTTNGLNDSLNNLTVSTTGQTCNTAGVLTVIGKLSVTSGTFSNASTLTVKDTLSLAGGSFTLAANVSVEGIVIITSGTLGISSSTFTLASGATFTHSAGSVTVSTGTFQINGTYTHSSGTFTITSTAAVSVGSTGTLALNSGVFNMLGRTLTCAGTITRTSGSIHYTAGSGTIAFTNTTAKTLPSNMFLRYPANFTLNGAGGITLGGNTRTAATDSLGLVTFTSGNLTLTSGITAIGSISGSGGNIVGNATATLTFYGAATNTLTMNQTTPGITNAVGVLNVNGTSNVTLGTNFQVLTTLTLNARTLAISTFTLTLGPSASFTNSAGTVSLGAAGSFVINGIYTHSSGTFTISTGSVTVGSTGTLALNSGVFNMAARTLTIAGTVTRTSGSIHFTAASGTVVFTNTTAKTLPSNMFLRYPANFTLNGAGGIVLGGNTRAAATDSLGVVTFTSGNLTLTSGITAISSISGSGGNIVGNATATLTFYGAATNTLRMDQTTPGTTNAVSVLNVNGTSNVTLGTNFEVLTTLTLNARTLAISTFTLTLGPSATFTHSAGTVSLGAAGSFVINGTYTHSSGTFTISTGSVTVGSTGTLVLNTGVFNMAARTLTIAGTVTRTSGSIHFTAASGTVVFTNTTAKTLPSNMFLRYPANFTLNGAGGIVLGGNIRAAATDSLGVVTFTSGNLTLTSGITAISSISGSGGNIVGNATATLTFYGAATNTLRMDQTTPGSTNAVNVLTLNGTSNVTLGSNLDVKTTLTLNARTLNLGSFTLTKTGTFTNGTATVQLSSGTFNISGAYTHVNTGTLTFGSGTLSVGSLTMTSGNINVSTGTLSIAGAVSRTSGQIHAPSGTVRFTNSSAITLPSNTFVTYPANFTLNGAGGVILGGKTGTLKDSLGNLTFTSGNLTITTDTTCIGSITGSGGNVVSNSSASIRFYGSGSSTMRTVQTTPGTSNAFKNLLLTGSSNVTLGTATRITANGLVSIPSSTTLSTGGLLTIVSNASGHGRIGTVGGTFTSSSTDSIQLYIPGGTRGYRLFGNPFTSALAISQFTDNVTEIDVTGSGGSGNGFTNTINNNPSAYTYNTSGNSWTAITNTSQTIPVGFGAHILVRGVKGQGLDGAAYTPSAATLRLSGQFRTGTVVTSLSDAGLGWNLVANPYPSNIDINQISSGDWNSSNVNAAIYGYDKVNRTYSAYSKNIGGAVNNLSNIIEMGSSFLAEVTTAGAASITFRESIKTDASSTVSGNPIFTPKTERFNQFKFTLSGEVEQNFTQDECLLSFGNSSNGSAEFDAQSDAWDLGGEMLNVSIITPNNDFLAINEYPDIEKQTQSIPLNVWAKNNGEYKLEYTEVSTVNENTEIWLRDKYKGEIHLIQESPYTFEINDLEESYGANRFEIFTIVHTSNLTKLTNKNPLRVFPNPIESVLNKVSVFIPREGHKYLIPTWYDMAGKMVFVGQKIEYTTNTVEDIALPKGLSGQNYILRCETNQGVFTQQVSILNVK